MWESARELIDYSDLPYENFEWVRDALAWPDFVGKEVEKLHIARRESAAGRAVLQTALDNYAKAREKERQSVIEMRGSLLVRMKKGSKGDEKTSAREGTDFFGTGGTPADPKSVDRPKPGSRLLKSALEQAESAKMHAERARKAGTKEAAAEEARRPFDTAGREGEKKIDPKSFKVIEGSRKGVLGDRQLRVLPKELLENPGWKILQNAERTLLIDIEQKRLAINTLEKRAEAARQTVRISPVLFILVPALAACAAPGGTKGSAPSRLPSVSTYHSGLIEQLDSEDWKVRSKAAGELVKIGKPAVPELLEALTGEATTARSHAADALGDIKDPRAVEPLIWALGVSSAETRERAAYALGRIGDERAARPLSRLLNDPDREVREAAARALRKTDRTGMAFAELVKAEYRDDIDVFEKSNYGYALSEIRDNLTTLRELVRALSHSDDLVRTEAARHLGIYFKDQVSDPGERSEAVAALMTASRDTVPGVRGMALLALGQTKDRAHCLVS